MRHAALLPIPYIEIAHALNHAYRETRWHNRAVPLPRGRLLAQIGEGGIRLDILELQSAVYVMPRPTDWSNFHSFSPNACLAKNGSIKAAVDKVYRRLSGKDIPTGHPLALIGFSQAGYVATRLGMALVAGRHPLHQKLSITTFNTAPFTGEFDEAQASIGPITTNYRTAMGGTAPNRLGYRVGDYVSMLGPLPGRTLEVQVRTVGDAPSYAGLHADPYLLPDDSADWSLKDISAQRNPGLAMSSAIQRVWETSCKSPRALMGLVGRAMLLDAKMKRSGLDPCLAAQLENVAGFARCNSKSMRWRMLGRLADALLKHPSADRVWRNSEMLVGRILRAAEAPLGAPALK